MRTATSEEAQRRYDEAYFPLALADIRDHAYDREVRLVRFGSLRV
ncbi:MAG: hypothetical protein OHK0013_11970 [Sandaracinaceae bacterium]